MVHDFLQNIESASWLWPAQLDTVTATLGPIQWPISFHPLRQAINSNMYTVNVIGCGKVGKTLAKLICQTRAGEIQDLYSRSPQSAQNAAEFIGSGHVVRDLAAMRVADIWLIAVPDSQISGVSDALAQVSNAVQAPNLDMPVAFHCSGFEPSTLLEPLQAKGFGVASVHPAMSFADPILSVTMFKGTPCAIEGDPRSTALLGKWVCELGGSAFELKTGNKGLYHAAAVFSANLNVVLQAVALEAWQASGVQPDVINKLHAALLGGTTQNLLQMEPADALTGPAARGDERVVRLQHDIVKQWHPEAAQAYEVLSKLASRLASSGQTQIRSNDRP